MAARYHRRRYQQPGGRLRAFFVGRAVRRVFHLTGIRRGWVLDIPCGSGVAMGALAGAERYPLGADVSLGMLDHARALTGTERRAAWVCADIELLPFRRDALAAVICLRFFAHLPLDRWQAVLQALAGLTPGPIVIGLPMRRSSKHWWRALKRWLGLRAKGRPIFRKDAVTAILETTGLRLRHRIWQSPFTDTALLVVQRGRAISERGRSASCGQVEGNAAGEQAWVAEPMHVAGGRRGTPAHPLAALPVPRP